MDDIFRVYRFPLRFLFYSPLLVPPPHPTSYLIT